jgi:hypothetical protein
MSLPAPFSSKPGGTGPVIALQLRHGITCQRWTLERQSSVWHAERMPRIVIYAHRYKRLPRK